MEVLKPKCHPMNQLITALSPFISIKIGMLFQWWFHTQFICESTPTNDTPWLTKLGTATPVLYEKMFGSKIKIIPITIMENMGKAMKEIKVFILCD